MKRFTVHIDDYAPPFKYITIGVLPAKEVGLRSGVVLHMLKRELVHPPRFIRLRNAGGKGWWK